MEWLKNLWKKIVESDNEPFIKKIEHLKKTIQELTSQLLQLQETIEEQQTMIKEYEETLSNEDFEDELRTYWQTKIPHNNNFKYNGRKCLIDPRILFTPIDNTIPRISGAETNDETVLRGMKLVRQTITYDIDKNVHDAQEWWSFPYETWKLRRGDCDSQAILLASVLLKSGVPAWRVRIVAGDVVYGKGVVGHCWCCYLREKDNKWLVLDTTYYFSEKGRLWKSAEKYMSTWFSFDVDNIYIKDEMDRDGN
jgi:predicted transglutaminase-like cysteine proteinase